MALGLRLDLKQSQQLVMTPQLQQAIRLLQMSNLEVNAYVEQELERNPLLARDEQAETPPDPADAEPPDAAMQVVLEPDQAAALFDTGTENVYDTSPGDPGTRLPGETSQWAGGRGKSSSSGASHGDGLAPGLDSTLQDTVTLRRHLLAQLGQMRATDHRQRLAGLIVEQLDPQGFLRDPLSEVSARLGVSHRDIEGALRLVQSCDPTGVGARDLAECFALQLAERDRLDPAMQSLIDHLALIAEGNLARLRRLCGVDIDDFEDMLAELRDLDPRPCAGFDTEPTVTVIPDVFVRRGPHGGWQIELNAETLPKLLIDRRYGAQIGRDDSAAVQYLASCRAEANWLIRSLDQRARTILAVSSEIVRQQDRFFEIGVEGLKPMTLRSVAEETGLHESTASRVTSNKYIATERGIFELRFFFTNAIGARDAAGGMSAEAVRHRIKAMVAAETAGQVLSDDAIVNRLRADGIDIARRTVAKYRKSLKIPSSVDRRRRLVAAGAAEQPNREPFQTATLTGYTRF